MKWANSSQYQLYNFRQECSNITCVDQKLLTYIHIRYGASSLVDLTILNS